MGGECSTHVADEKYIQNFGGKNLKVDQSVDGD
jgi:hypothetical protein